MDKDYQNSNQNEENNNCEDNQKKQKKKKVKAEKGCLYSLITFVLKIGLFIIAVVFIISAIKTYQRNSEQKAITKRIEEIEEATRDKNLKIESSDLIAQEDMQKDYDQDGLTNEEELKIKTDPMNLDTDNDGIADGTEVQMYKTDPLKYSTAGDDISDGAKVNAKLDPYKKISLIDKIKHKMSPTTIDVEESKVKIKTSDLETMSNYIVNEYPIENIKYKQIATPIVVHNVKGKVIIPLNVSSTETTKAAYYNEYTKSFTPIKADVSEDTVSIDVEKENPLPIILYNSLPDDVQVDYDKLENEDTRYFVLKISADALTEYDVLGWTKDYPKKVLILRENKDIFDGISLSEEDITKYLNLNGNVTMYFNEINSLFYEACRDLFISIVDGFFGKEDVDSNGNPNIKIITYEEFYGKGTNIKDNIDGKKAQDNQEIVDNRKSLFGKTYHANTKFDVKKDAPSFSNFSVTQGGNNWGNCAGFAALTTLIYNEKYIPRQYSFNNSNETFEYNINDKAYNSFITKGSVYDYKMTTSKNSGDLYDTSLMEGNKDAQVINMIGALWKRANIDLNPLTNKESVLAYVGSGFEALDAFGSGSNIKGYANILEERANQDKVTYLGLSKPKGGHAITAIGINTNPVNPDIVDVTVYDNNYPNNKLEKDGKLIDMSKSLKLRLILKEEKKNIFGQTKKLLSEKYLYYQGEEFKDNPEDYESVGGYNNLDINDYSLKSYLTAIQDEDSLTFK